MSFYSAKILCTGLAVFCGLNLAGNVQAIEVGKLQVIGVGNKVTPTEVPPTQDVPMGQSTEGQVSLLPEEAQPDEDDLFGGMGGFLHANLMLQEEYTDNLYNINTDETSTFITTVSPAIWFTVPRKKEIPVNIAPNNTSPGGLALTLRDYEGTDRYQAYALGGLDFEYYSEDDDLNTINGLAEGLLRYNLRGGLSLQLLDRFSRDQDKYDAGSVIGVSEDQFDSNIVLATVDYRITEKLRAKFEYSNFWLDYEDDVNLFQDRADNVFDLYGFYIYSEKTSFFVEGKYVDVQYDDATVNDNTQNFIYGGIKWATTEKVSLLAKAGWQNKEFENDGAEAAGRSDYDGFAVDVQGTYSFTEKTKMTLDLYRTNEETDSVDASDKTVLGATLGYAQRFTEKISGSMAFSLADEEYTQLVEQDRDDTTFALQPAAQYLFREWLMGEVSYQFEKRDSSDDLFDYETNTVFANVKFAL